MSDLTPYDTGAVAEPFVWPPDGDPERYGKVDFDNAEGGTVATVRVVRQGGRYVIQIEAPVGDIRATSDGLAIETDVAG